MSEATKQRIKLYLRRWTLRQARYLFDWLEDRLHAAEVTLRNDLEQRTTWVTQRARSRSGAGAAVVDRAGALRASAPTTGENFAQWEARRAGVLPATHIPRRRHVTAASFDLRFSRGSNECR